MFSIQESTSAAPRTANLLPCQINHDGPVDIPKRMWNPNHEEGQGKTAYFRGRKLLGRTVPLKEGFKGVLVKSTEKVLEKQNAGVFGVKLRDRNSIDAGDDDEKDAEDEDEDEEPVRLLEVNGTFDEVVVWGHEEVPAPDDQFVRGLTEWIDLADAMHSFDSTEEEASAG